jgi:hypothetical protein
MARIHYRGYYLSPICVDFVHLHCYPYGDILYAYIDVYNILEIEQHILRIVNHGFAVALVEILTYDEY